MLIFCILPIESGNVYKVELGISNMHKLLTSPLAITPQWLINLLSHAFAPIAYYAIPKWRKRALSNLALATDLNLRPKEIRRIAKASFANLLICALEYPKFAHRKKFKWARCTNPEPAASLIEKGQGIIFFCGHQANWEVLFFRRHPAHARRCDWPADQTTKNL